MEVAQFVSYLDYGVLGLSAIILILSYILLSREQKREVFRPEVEKAIRRYMTMAMAFAGIGLISTIVDGVMVRPSKAERLIQEQRLDLLSNKISEEMEMRMESRDGENTGIKNVQPLVDGDSTNNAVDTTDIVVPDSVMEYNNIQKSLFLSFYDFRADKNLFKQSLDKLGEHHSEVETNKDKILKDYDNIADMKLKWLEESAIPAIEESKKKGVENPKVIVDLPSELVLTPKGSNKVVVSNLDQLKSEAELLRTSKKK